MISQTNAEIGDKLKFNNTEEIEEPHTYTETVKTSEWGSMEL
jgi:hypothetical protein